MARKVNFVWNFCNDSQKHALTWGKKWPTGYQLEKLTAGSSTELGIQSDIIGKVCHQYERSRKSHRKRYLRYRGQKNLGWVPVKGRQCRSFNDGFFCHGTFYSVWLSRRTPEGAKICDGTSFSQDTRGRWYLNLVLEIPDNDNIAQGSVGIDLGLKDLATLSTGEKIAAQQFYRNTQKRLATAQRARKKRQVKAISARIASQRRDHLHKVSTNIVKNHGLIVVGNVNSSKLKKTRMAKSVSDAGWHSFKEMLAYKSDCAGAKYIEVNEAFTTQICSVCGNIGGPQGRQGLSVRAWSCGCGASHDRDVNSARNILRIGQDTLTGAALSAELPSLLGVY